MFTKVKDALGSKETKDAVKTVVGMIVIGVAINLAVGFTTALTTKAIDHVFNANVKTDPLDIVE